MTLLVIPNWIGWALWLLALLQVLNAVARVWVWILEQRLEHHQVTETLRTHERLKVAVATYIKDFCQRTIVPASKRLH